MSHLMFSIGHSLYFFTDINIPKKYAGLQTSIIFTRYHTKPPTKGRVKLIIITLIAPLRISAAAFPSFPRPLQSSYDPQPVTSLPEGHSSGHWMASHRC